MADDEDAGSEALEAGLFLSVTSVFAMSYITTSKGIYAPLLSYHFFIRAYVGWISLTFTPTEQPESQLLRIVRHASKPHSGVERLLLQSRLR